MAGQTEALAALHQLHLDLQQVNEELERGPRQIRARERLIAAGEAKVAELREQLQQTRAAADRKSLDLKTREAKLADLRAKLNECSSNREYDLLRGQIEADEAANSVHEDEILESLEKVDQTQREIGEAEGEVKQLQAECREFTAKVEAAAAGLEQQARDLQTRIKEAETILAGDNREKYRRLIDTHGADGMAGVDSKGVCLNCYVALTAQAQVQIRAGQIMFCTRCGRLVYAAE